MCLYVCSDGQALEAHFGFLGFQHAQQRHAQHAYHQTNKKKQKSHISADAESLFMSSLRWNTHIALVMGYLIVYKEDLGTVTSG